MSSSTTDRRLGLTGDKGMKAPVDCARTANITLSGEQTIDGVTTSTSRVLVKNQTTTTQNGIWNSSSAAWTRALDADGYQDLVNGTMVLVSGGATQVGQVYQVSGTNPITIGTSAIAFSLSLTYNAATVAYTPAGTGADATTVQEKLRTYVSLFDNLTASQILAYQALSYATDLSPALEEIIATLAAGPGGDIYLPPGGCLFDNVNLPDDSKIRIFGSGAATIPKKGANGPMFTLGKQCIVENLVINGNGGSYTGQGIYVSTGALDNFSWRRMRGVDIYNTASYCLEFSGNRAGYASQISDCRFVPTSTATYAIKAANNGGVVEDNGNRQFRNIWTFGNRIADLTDANDCDFVACHGFFPKFTTTTNKCNFTGGRLNLYDATDQFTGTANVVDGVTLNANGGAALTILSSATNCRFAPSIAVGSGITVTDNSGSATSGNEVWLPRSVYTPTWGGTGGTPAIGNGALGAVCTRRGTAAMVNILLNIGSTTAFNTATGWTFTVPYTAARTCTGSAYILDSGTSHYIGIAKIDAGANTLSVFRDAAGLGVGYLIPMTWATSDLLRVDIEYEIQ